MIAMPIETAATRVDEVDDFQSIDATLVANRSQQDVVVDIRRRRPVHTVASAMFEAQRASARRLEYGPCDAVRLLE
jgi:capsule polysaccharide modification protein KpsS